MPRSRSASNLLSLGNFDDLGELAEGLRTHGAGGECEPEELEGVGLPRGQELVLPRRVAAAASEDEVSGDILAAMLARGEVIQVQVSARLFRGPRAVSAAVAIAGGDLLRDLPEALGEALAGGALAVLGAGHGLIKLRGIPGEAQENSFGIRQKASDRQIRGLLRAIAATTGRAARGRGGQERPTRAQP